ncbi:MAG TPA: DUF2207 domain-containing protein [Candidatus Limnocylindria bacterium]|nr:DUF2207 domain-containing protein [Candidatus Limnocylindria bacterium]
MIRSIALPGRARILGLLALVFFLTAALPFAPLAAAREYSVKDFNEQVTVNPDGTIEVTEIIDVRFVGAYHGIYRTIPVEYDTPQHLNYSLLLEPLSITDDDAHPLKYEQTRQGRYLKFKITVPNAENATRTVILRYRILNALRFFEDHDELYWNVTGDEWDVPIESSSAHIELPAGTTGIRAVAYTGVFGSRAQDAGLQINGNKVEIQTNHPLGFHQGLTAVVGWDKGFVHEPGGGARLLFFLRSNWPLFVPISAFFIMLWLWWTRGRDPERDAVTVQYEPPDKLTPGECGTLVENEAAMRDITATLVDLAVKGYMVIEQKEEDHLLGLTHSKEYIFHLKQPAAQWAAARPHEREMLSALFDDGANTDVKMSDLQNHFYTHLPAIRDWIFGALMTDGYYLHRPDTVRQAYVGAGIVIGILIFVFGSVLASATGVARLTWSITAFATGAVICIFGWFMPARTLAGARTYARVLGFENFLGRVESDHIERLEKTPELFEKFLPYAMALHVEKKWVQAFAGIAMQPPQWYQGPYGAGFQPYIFVNDLNYMSAQAGSVMASSPRSESGGSGFGGGGGSGGGFGGGGGGAW